jgi:large subunit ribosomal protein L19
MSKIKSVEEVYQKKDIPEFKVGDTIRVMVKVPEADKVRIHPFEGTVIRKRKGGVRATFTVRNIFYGEGVERIFPLHSPNIDKIEIIRKGKVRRSKLYYIRKRIGKKAKISQG